MNRIARSTTLAATVAVLVSFLAVPLALAEGPDNRTRVTADRYAQPAERYQIVRSTEHRVWRLDKVSGEITMCSLQRDRMVCANSSNALVAPKRSYEELAQERQAKKAQERDAQIAMLDRMLMLFRELVASSIEREAASAE